MIDAAGRRLIALRNGFGAVSPDELAVLARMQTNRQARAVLGVVAQYLRKGYEIAATVTTTGTGIAQKQMFSLLDQTNKRAQQVYAGIPDDDMPLTDLNRKKVVQVAQQTLENIRLIGDAAAELNRGLLGALADVLAEKLLPPWAQGTPQARALALKVGIGLAVVVGLVVAGKLVHAILLGRSSALSEAEDAAMALADAKRRKRSSRSVYTVA